MSNTSGKSIQKTPRKITSSRKRHQQELVKKILLTTAIAATIIAVFCLIRITFWWLDNQHIQEETELAQITANLSAVAPNPSKNTSSNDEFNPYWDFADVNFLEADFEALKELNSEIKAWLTLGGTNINYPVTQHADNDFYLSHSLSNASNSGGWVFMDYRNHNFGKKTAGSAVYYPQNTIIYAHGRQDRSMFGSLYKVLYQEWSSRPENHILKVSTPDSNSLWQVFSVYQLPNTNDYIQTDFQNESEYINFLEKLKNRSFFDFQTEISVQDRIITLSTCANDREKIVLHAKLYYSEERSWDFRKVLLAILGFFATI